MVLLLVVSFCGTIKIRSSPQRYDFFPKPQKLSATFFHFDAHFVTLPDERQLMPRRRVGGLRVGCWWLLARSASVASAQRVWRARAVCSVRDGRVVCVRSRIACPLARNFLDINIILKGVSWFVSWFVSWAVSLPCRKRPAAGAFAVSLSVSLAVPLGVPCGVPWSG